MSQIQTVSLGSEPQSLHYCQGYILHGAGEGNRGCALLMTANKPETVLYRAPTFLLSLSHTVKLVHAEEVNHHSNTSRDDGTYVP